MIAFVLAELGPRPGLAHRRRDRRSWAATPGRARAGSSSRGTSPIAPSSVLRPEIAVVTNVELDHHSTFASEAEVEELFERWLAEVPQGRSRLGARAGVTRARVPGTHNRRNAAAALAALELAGVARADAEPRARRASAAPVAASSTVGEQGGVTVVDDYAHHPSEIVATIAAARERTDGRVLVLFQPHLYSRTRHLAYELGAALSAADAACVTEIYRAREEPIEGVDGKLVVDALRRRAVAPAGRPASRTVPHRRVVGAAGRPRAHGRRR